MKKLKSLLSFLLVVTTLVGHSAPAKILVITPLGTKSHKHVFEPLIKALGKRSHDLTVITNTKSTYDKNASNIHEYIAHDVENFTSYFPNPFDRREMGILSSMWDFRFVREICDTIFQDPKFLELVHQPYDLVIMNAFMNICFAGLLPRIGAPFIYVTSMGASNMITTRFGNYLPPSFVPNAFFPFPDDMTFVERLLNFILDTFFLALRDTVYAPIYEAVYRKHLGADLPGLAEIESNVSLLFMNSYMNFPSLRPATPDIIEVGGMHCRPAKPVSAELDEFLRGTEEGFVYFSLGSVIKAKTMPKNVLQVFINVFSRLKQRVLWKWDEEIPNLPSNIKLVNWLPQQDILGHKNIRMFITHGGLLSSQEAIYHGVPLVGIPMFIDQDYNMMQAEAAGFATTVEILNITESKLESAIQSILQDPRKREQAQTLSKAFKDQMQSPTDRAIYWVEYIIRHKGAHHLRSAARHLNFYQYHSIDVVSFLFLSLSIVSYLLYFVFSRTLRWLRTKLRTSKSRKIKVN